MVIVVVRTHISCLTLTICDKVRFVRSRLAVGGPSLDRVEFFAAWCFSSIRLDLGWIARIDRLQTAKFISIPFISIPGRRAAYFQVQFPRPQVPRLHDRSG